MLLVKDTGGKPSLSLQLRADQANLLGPHLNSNTLSNLFSFLLLLDLLCATIATVSDFPWEFLRLPTEGKSSAGLCYFHTQREAAAPRFHSWCTAIREEHLCCLLLVSSSLRTVFFPQSSRPAARLSPSTILNPSPGRKHAAVAASV